MPRILYVKLRYAIEQEMVAKPTDFFIRRTGDLFFNIKNVRDAQQDVLTKMSHLLNWTDEEKQRYEEELEDELRKATSVV